MINFFWFEIFWNLWRINTLDLSNQHFKFGCPALPCCSAPLPQSFEDSAKRVPQGNFSISSIFKFRPRPPDMLANFMYVSYLKTILCCRHPLSHNELISGGHFWAKKHNIQLGDEIFFDSKSFKSYGGLTPSTSQISIPSLVVLRCPAAVQRYLIFLKIQQRG